MTAGDGAGAIVVDHLSKAYQLYQRPSDRLLELLLAGRRSFHQDFWALRDVSFSVRRGSTVGIVGRNGSGKSTLLQIIAGTVRPTGGTVRVEGRVSALLELGTGFNPEFTGRENVLMNAAILGYSRAEIASRLPRIMEFAEIGPFFDRPVKTYSSGMQVRLAFATSISVDPDVLIVDEALAVGDVAFQHRCMRKFHELKEQGVTVLFVSHSPEAVKSLCEEAILLEGGEVHAIGRAEPVVNAYLGLLFGNKPLAQPVPVSEVPAFAGGRVVEDPMGGAIVIGVDRSDGRIGNGSAEILGIRVENGQGERVNAVASGSRASVKVSVRFAEAVPQPMIGFTLRNSLGMDITRTNTEIEGVLVPPAHAGDVFTARFDIQIPYLAPGSYAFTAGVANGTTDDFQVCDRIQNAVLLQITSEYQVHGQLRLPASGTVYCTRGDKTAGVPFIEPVRDREAPRPLADHNDSKARS